MNDGIMFRASAAEQAQFHNLCSSNQIPFLYEKLMEYVEEVKIRQLRNYITIEMLCRGLIELYTKDTVRKYRIKEFNRAYDEYFGKNRGWIFCTNELTELEAEVMMLYYKKNEGLKHEIVKIY